MQMKKQASLLLATLVVANPFSPALSQQWVTTYRGATCLRNGVPELCDVYYNSKEVTWKVLWKGIGGTRYYSRRGGNFFLEVYENGAQAGVWELDPRRQTLSNDSGDVIKIFGL
jgi:hypothetical protein